MLQNIEHQGKSSSKGIHVAQVPCRTLTQRQKGPTEKDTVNKKIKI